MTLQFMTQDEIAEALHQFDSMEPQIQSTQPEEKYLRTLIPQEHLEEFFSPSDGIIPCEISSDSSLDIQSLPQSVDLRKYDTPVDDQGREGTCTAHATMNYLMFKISKETGKKLDLSEWAHWLNYRKYNSWEASRALVKHWQGEERFWPDYSNKALPGWEDSQVATLSSPRELYSIVEMQKQLARGEPILLSVGLDAAYWTNAVVLGDRGTQKSGHAILVVGYVVDKRWKSGGYFIIKNSWSTRHGDKGYNYVSFDYFTTGRFYSHCIVFADKINWKPGKEPNRGAENKYDVKPVCFKKYSYSVVGSQEHTAYGLTLHGKDSSKVKSVEYKINKELPSWPDRHEFDGSIGTYARSGYPVATVLMTMEDGSVVTTEVSVP